MSEQLYGALGTFQVRYKPTELTTFRNPANVAEMVNHCNSHSHIWVRDLRGNARTVKVNGKVRTWKRDPNRIEVPCKYGLYEYFLLTAQDISDVLIPVEESK